MRGFDEPIFPAGASTPPSASATRSPWPPTMPPPNTAIRQMLAAVRPGGVLVVQLLNLWRLPDGPCVWQKCQRPLPLRPLSRREGVRVRAAASRRTRRPLIQRKS